MPSIVMKEGCIKFVSNKNLLFIFQTVNIPDAYLDARFDPSVDDGTGFKHNTILCMAIKNSEGRIIGVIQVTYRFPIGAFPSSLTFILIRFIS